MKKEVKEICLESKKSSADDLLVWDADSKKPSSSRFSFLFASKDRDFLLSPTGNQVKVPDLEHKVVGLYFAANWYPACRSFNPVLADVYEQLKSHGVGFEIVYVSSDEDSDAFNRFRACMPWLAVPFSDLETKRALNRRFDVEGIPCLIVLQPYDSDDDAVLREGVELIYRYGVRAYPFTNERLKELEEEEKEKHENQTITNLLTHPTRDFLLGHSSPNQVMERDLYIENTVQGADGYFQLCMQVPVASLVGKTIGLYFSAQWCIPGVKFTPKLISIYQKIKQMLEEEKEEDFEIVLVSCDRNQAEFASYFGTMPWLALPFGDPTIKTLHKYFDVRGIPLLVIIGQDGKTLTKQGRNLINLYQEKAYPFTGAQLEVLEKQMNEEAMKLPRSQYHAGHRHELTLVSEGTGGGPFICCDCDEQGSGWTYQCIECGYEVHPKCVRAVSYGSTG